MWCSVITVFPTMFDLVQNLWRHGACYFRTVLFSLETLNLRDFALDKQATVDDRTFGGGPGMVFKPEPLTRAIQAAKQPLPKVQK